MITQENIPYTADEIKAMVKTCEKYNKAREKARELMDKGYDVLMPEIFPELNESEDEKIKREIVAYINELADLKNEKIPTKWLDWLEKQDAKKPTLPKWKYKKDNIPLLKDSLILNKYGCVAKSPSGAIVSDVWVLDYDELAKLPKEKLEKQGEKDPCTNCINDKGCVTCENGNMKETETAPKFKVGDWITNGCLTCKVLGVTGKSYELHLYNDDYCHFETDIQSVNKYYHLWSIQDAKDGDVLVRETGEPFIYNGNHGSYIPEFLGAYCGISDGRFRPNGSTYYWGKPSYPATKEQCDLLFQKMKEAGYEWDSEKKELKKIEPKTLDANKVIKWLNDQACLGWLEDVEVEKVVEQFKKDFGL